MATKWDSTKRTKLYFTLFTSITNLWVWFAVRYGFDTFVLIVYTSLNAGGYALGIMRQFKIGQFVKIMGVRT